MLAGNFVGSGDGGGDGVGVELGFLDALTCFFGVVFGKFGAEVVAAELFSGGECGA